MTQSSSPVAANSTEAGAPHLKRVLGLWDLIFYGIVLIQPIAPIPLFGVAQQRSGGFIVDTLLIAMAAMMITAFSFGRMSALYPSAGSAYTYVCRGLNPHLGFLAGWAMVLEYLLQPLINAVWVSVALHRLFPQLPYWVAALLFIVVITYLNLRGVKASARANEVLLAFMFIIIAAFFVLGVRYILVTAGFGALFSMKPFYVPETFNFTAVRRATSLAALTYVGFDGVTTLAEDVKNPKRNVLLATVGVCFLVGILGGLEVYLGQVIWPDYHTFPNLETAFVDIGRRVGGPLLSNAMAAMLILAATGTALSGGLGAARLLFGMGRDNVLPRRIFGHLDEHNTPSFNLWLIGGLAFVGAMFLGFDKAAEVLNFGAFLAFMGVNLATVRQFYFSKLAHHKRNILPDCLLPLFGFLFCFWIWLGLQPVAMIVGGIWFLVGILWVGFQTRWFRDKPVAIDFSGK